MSKVTVTYNGNTITEATGQTSPVSVTYNSNIITTITDGSSKTLSCANKVMRDNIYVGGKTLSCSGRLMRSNVGISVESEITWLPVGGRIFYVGADNGATYTFYDINGDILPTQTVAGLATAIGYNITGTPTADKFYVYDSTNGLATDKEWGAYRTSVGITSDGIGLGKTNTATALANSACFTPEASGTSSDTIWKYLRDSINANSVGGCNDWYIGTGAEQNQLKSSGLVDWYSSNYVWCSVEYNNHNAYFWNYSSSNWFRDRKSSQHCFIPFRSF